MGSQHLVDRFRQALLIGLCLPLGFALLNWGGVAMQHRLLLHGLVAGWFLAAGIFTLFVEQAPNLPLPRSLLVISTALLFIAGMSLFYTSALTLGVQQLLLWSDGFLILLGSSWLLRPQLPVERLGFVFCLLLFVLTIFFIGMRADVLSSQLIHLNKNHWAALFELLLFWPIAWLWNDSPFRRTYKIPLLFILAAAFACHLATLSRGGIIALMFTLAMMLRIWPLQRAKKNLGKYLLAALVVAALLHIASEWFLPIKPTSIAWRGEFLAASLRIVSQHPWLGTGLGSFGDQFLAYTRLNTTDSFDVYAHNDYVQILSELGPLALGLIVLAIYLFLRTTWKRQPIANPVFQACFGGITALLVHSCFDFVLNIPLHLALFCLTVAIALQFRRPIVETAALRQSPRHLSTQITMTVTLIIVLSLLFFVPDIRANYLQQSRTLRNNAQPLDAIIPASRAIALRGNSTAILEQARLFQELELTALADKQFLLAIKLDPGNANLKVNLAEHYLFSGRHDEALQWYQNAFAIQPRLLSDYFTALTTVIQDPLQLKTVIPSDVNAQKIWIDYLIKSNFMHEALLALQANAQQNDQNCREGFLAMLIDLELRQKQLPAAKLAIDQLKAQCADRQVDYHLFTARLLLQSTPIPGADVLQHATAVLMADPDNQSAIALVAEVIVKQPQLKTVWEGQLDGLLRKYPQHPVLLMEECRLLEASGDWQGAIVVAKQLVGAHLHDIGYKKLLASLYMKRKMYDQVFRLYRDILQQEPMRLEVYGELAAAYMELNLPQEALKVVERGLQLAPDNAELRHQRLKLQASLEKSKK